MEAKFCYSAQDACFLVAVEDAPGYVQAGFKDNYEGDAVIAGTPFEDGRPIHGLLRIRHYHSSAVHADAGAAKIVCRENPLFQIDVSQFSIEDKHLLDDGALSDAIYFKIAPGSESLRVSKLRFSYWQIRILTAYLEQERPSINGANSGALAYCDGIIFRKANTDEYHLSSVRMTDPVEVTWVSDVPERLFGNEFGDLFLFDPHVRKDELSISSNVLLQVQ